MHSSPIKSEFNNPKAGISAGFDETGPLTCRGSGSGMQRWFAPALLIVAVLVVAGCGDRSSDTDSTVDADAAVFTTGNQQVIEPNPSEGVVGLFPSSPGSAGPVNTGTDSEATVSDQDVGDSQDNMGADGTGNDADTGTPDLPDSTSSQDAGETNVSDSDPDLAGPGETDASDDGSDEVLDTVSPPQADPLPVVIDLSQNVDQLSLSGIQFDQVFQSQQLSYTASVPYLLTSTTLVINGQPVQDLVLAPGTNTILLQSPANGPVYNLSIQRDPRENFSSVAYIKDSSSLQNTLFGTDVSVDGEWMAILGRNVHQRVVMQRLQNGVWVQDQVLDAAGDSLSLDGDILAVGDTMSGGREVPGFSFGIVRIFERDDSGWRQLATVQAANGDDADRFGHSVAVSGDTLIVGAPGEDSGATGINGDGSRNDALDAGAVYVFQRQNPGQWVQQAYVKGDATGGGDRLGFSVAIDAERFVAGAVLEESSARGINGNQLDNGRHGSGAAYIFERSQGNWRQRAYLKADNADADDMFGYAVDIQGDRVAVSAVAEDSGSLSDPSDNSVRDSGAVYLFVDAADGWRQSSYIKASNPGDTDAFGHAVALQSQEGNALAVGAPAEDAIGPLLSGMPLDNSVADNGAVYVYTPGADQADGWREILYLHAQNQDSGDSFGHALAFEAGNLVVAAPQESSDPRTALDPADNSLAGAGAVYVFR